MAVSKIQLYANQITAQTIHGVHRTLTPRSGKSHYCGQKDYQPTTADIEKSQNEPISSGGRVAPSNLGLVD